VLRLHCYWDHKLFDTYQFLLLFRFCFITPFRYWGVQWFTHGL